MIRTHDNFNDRHASSATRVPGESWPSWLWSQNHYQRLSLELSQAMSNSSHVERDESMFQEEEKIPPKACPYGVSRCVKRVKTALLEFVCSCVAW